MKIATTILILLALALLIFNLTLVDFSRLRDGDSQIALIGIAASMCAILVLLIFKLSKKIEEKTKN